eukprot:COSAG02_NODE_3432_length_6751_cov_3.338094_4_plen_78_part_00
MEKQQRSNTEQQFSRCKVVRGDPTAVLFRRDTQMRNVTIQDNELEPSKLTFRKGTDGKGDCWKGACIDMTTRNNTRN